MKVLNWINNHIDSIGEIKLGNNFISFLFPNEVCPVCGIESYGICNFCKNNLNYYGDFYLSRGLNESIKCHALFYYSKTPERLIYSYKKKLKYNAKRELIKLIIERIEKLKILEDESIMVYVPSSKKMISDRGFDAGYEIAFEIAKHFNIELVNAFINEGKVENKKLNKEEREENSKAIKLNVNIENEILLKAKNSGKRLIIFDDIITTGASINRCIDLIKKEYEFSDDKILVLVILKQ